LTVVWNSHSQHEYLLIYSCKLKSAFVASQLLFLDFVAIRFVLQQKCQEMNRKCSPRNTTVQLQPPTPTLECHNALRYRQTDRLTDRQLYDDKRRSYCLEYDRLKNSISVDFITTCYVIQLTVVV